MDSRASKAAAVRSCLAAIQEDTEGFVQSFYERFLARHPRYRRMFGTDLRAQSGVMADILTTLVMHLEAPEVVRGSLRRLATRHREVGVKREDFEPFVSVLLETLADHPQVDWTEELAEAGRFFLDEVVDAIHSPAEPSEPDQPSGRAEHREAVYLTREEIALVSRSYLQIMADDRFFTRFLTRFGVGA